VSNFPQVPGYEIQSELGRGGMAVVYSAIEKDLDRPVAIKVVARLTGHTDGHIQRLENEARGLAALHHPHIVDLYRFGRTEDGSLYYVMPLLSGGTLEDIPKPMPEAKVIELLDHLLDALEHAHASDIIHRDIKPANILYDRFKRPMLADFGAAFMRQRDTRLTTHGEAIGSSGYMSPEQARGYAVDARSDLYSVAVLAFELLTGNRPFEGEDALSTALAQIEKPVPRLPDELRHWQSFFYRALAVNPEHRYSSAASMRSAIRNLHAKPVGDSRRWLWIGLAAAAVLLLGGIVFALSSRDSATATPPVAKSGPSPPINAFPPRPNPPATIAVPAAVTVATPAATQVEPNKAPAAVGDRFADPGGPELVVARAAKGSHPALAIMAAPVDKALYKRYADARHHAPPKCAGSVGAAQGCLSVANANDFASWMSKETGEKYRVPSRSELDEGMAHVAHLDAYAWTGTCNEVRVARSRNAAQRGWAKVRKAFGKPKPVEYDLRCEGNYTLKLDGKGDVAKPREGSSPDTLVVLLREATKR